MDQRGSAAELLVDQGLWVKGLVGKTLWRHLDTQWHQQMLVEEGVEEHNLADRFREQLHRDLANCYFTHDSSVFSDLLRFFDEQCLLSFHPFHRRPCSVARFCC